MKFKIFFAISMLALFAYIAYRGPVKKYITKKNNIEALHKAIDEATKSTLRSDTIFLGFCFGMSEIEFETHYKTLLSNKKLYNDDGLLAYDFHLNSGDTVKAHLSSEFASGELCSLKLQAKNKNINPWPEMTTLNLIFAYQAKYMYDYKNFSKESVMEDFVDSYIWIKNNKMIKVSQAIAFDALIEYEDLTARKELKLEKDKDAQEEQKIKASKSKQTYSDI